MRRAILTAVLMLVSAAAGAATLTETIDRTIDVKPGAAIVLTNVNGRITIGSWDQPRVHVIARKEVQGDRDEVKDVLRELRVEIQQRDGGVVITTHHPRNDGHSSIFDWILGDHIEREVRYDITVPRAMNVDVTNTNGSIHVTNVTGVLELDTTNGKIEVNGCAGSIDASTTNGSINAELVKVVKGGTLSLETTNGRIAIALPRDVAADVDARTTNGAIRTDLPVTTMHLGRNSLRGSLNGGGTPLRMRTTNGGIEIRVAGQT